MRVFKSKFKDRESGEMRETEKWYCDFLDAKRMRRRIPTDRCRNRNDAEKFGAMVEQLVVAASHSERPDAKVDTWLRGLSKATLARFAKFGLIDSRYTTEAIPLSRHVADFEAWLTTTKARHGFARSPTYIHNTITQINFIIEDCGFHFWNDITKAAVETCLGKLDVASKTFNAYQASIKLFADWMVSNDRASVSPVERIKPVRWTKTEERRALSQEESATLLRTTPFQPVYHGMSGVERAVLYLTALETGYRMNELRCLTVDCFDLDGASINLDAQHTKNHMDAVQLIRRSRVAQYRAFLAGRTADERVFAMPGDNEVLGAFRADLEAAGIKPVDSRGVKVTFHSLRYGLATALDKSGATLKERMTILRHSTTGNLTLGTYTTVEVVDLRGAIERLFLYPWPPAIKQASEEQAQAQREVA